MNRREFIGQGVSAAGALAIGGCRFPFGTSERLPYENVLADRLWMWGHHRDFFLKSKKDREGIAHETRIDQADACISFGIPNCCCIRCGNRPEKAELPEYMPQFRRLKRFAWSITDSAAEKFDEKVEIGFRLADEYPNLTHFWLDDYFYEDENSHMQPFEKLVAVKERLTERGMRLACVIYGDDNGFKESFRPTLNLCDEVSCWVWNGKNIGAMADYIRRLRDFTARPVLLGLYMYDFGGNRQMRAEPMERQLRFVERLLDDRALSGLIFHCTPLVDLDLDAVRISREWIKANRERRIG